MKILLATLAIAFVLPFGVYGAQAVFTERNVTVAYEEQIKAIDVEISRLEATLVQPTANMNWRERITIEDGTNLHIRGKISQLKEDKHTLEVAYGLITASFR